MRYVLLTAILLWLGGCAPDQKEGKDAFPMDVVLLCESLSGDETTPRADVYAQVKEQKIKIGEVSVCEPIPRDQYRSMKIPAEALTAVGGWFGGGGDYFYAVREEEAVVFYHGWLDELQEDDGFHYLPIVRFEADRFQIQGSLSPGK